MKEKKLSLKFKLLITLAIFIFSVLLRLWNLNQMGRTWDEFPILEKGYNFIELAKKGDFVNPYWWTNPDHPPLSNYFYGLAGFLDFQKFDKNLVPMYKGPSGSPVYNYDLTYSHLISALFASLTAVLIFLIGLRYFSFFIGLSASIFFSMLPFFLGLSQLVTHESLILFFFTASVYSFLRLLEQYSLKLVILTGILTGLALEVKQSNILLFPLFILLLINFLFFQKKASLPAGRKKLNRKLLLATFIYIPIISILIFLAFWPMPFFHLKETLSFTKDLWFPPGGGDIQELFLGKFKITPRYYYLVYFFVTTPVLVLFFFFAGIKNIFSKKNWLFYSLLLWFCFPFIQSFYSHRENGLRYIIEIYAPLSIIAGIGFDYIISKFKYKLNIKLILLFLVFGYLFITLYQISPFYLDYFNELAGGTKNVYEKKLFQMGWWGEGLKQQANYLEKNAPKGSTIGLRINPTHTIKLVNGLNYSLFKENGQYDFVIDNYYAVIRQGFNEGVLNKNYNLVYEESKDGAIFAKIYKKK